MLPSFTGLQLRRSGLRSFSGYFAIFVLKDKFKFKNSLCSAGRIKLQTFYKPPLEQTGSNCLILKTFGVAHHFDNNNEIIKKDLHLELNTLTLADIYKTNFWIKYCVPRVKAVQLSELSGLGRSDKRGIEKCPLWSKPTLAMA